MVVSREQYAQDRRRAAYRYEMRRNGLVIGAEVLPDGSAGTKLGEIPAPYTLVGLPYRGDMQALSIELAAGETPIWEHRQIFSAGDLREALIFGRRSPDGREDCVLVCWTGEVFHCASAEQARQVMADAVQAAGGLTC